jgi:hypothetical protein
MAGFSGIASRCGGTGEMADSPSGPIQPAWQSMPQLVRAVVLFLSIKSIFKDTINSMKDWITVGIFYNLCVV